jgi:hypothetical protein
VYVDFLDTEDMASLTRETIDAEHYVARYAQGRLSGSELEAFEEYCLLHPEMIPEVSADRALIRGAKALSASGELAAPLAGRKTRLSPALRNFAMAASVAALAILAWQWLGKGSADSPYSLYAAASDVPALLSQQHLAEPFRLVRTRNSTVPQIELPPGISLVQIELTPSDTAGASEYQVSLQSESGGQLTERATLARVVSDPDDPDVVKVFLEVGAVERAHLYLTLNAPGKPADVYELRLVRRR